MPDEMGGPTVTVRLVLLRGEWYEETFEYLADRLDVRTAMRMGVGRMRKSNEYAFVGIFPPVNLYLNWVYMWSDAYETYVPHNSLIEIIEVSRTPPPAPENVWNLD